MKFQSLICLTFLIFFLESRGQDGIGIGTNNPHPDAVLEISSSDKGLVIPRLISSTINTMPTSEGLLVYDLDISKFRMFRNGNWETLEPIPSGSIIMWNGVSPPSGWQICDGTNGTPDLREKFVVGYDPGIPDYNNPLNTGGSETHALITSEIPSHTHGVTDSGHTHNGSVTSSTHSHSLSFDDITTSVNNTDDGAGTDDLLSANTAIQSGSTTSNPYSVTLSSANAGLSLQNTGGGQPHENRPVYYVIAFIMKE